MNSTKLYNTKDFIFVISDKKLQKPTSEFHGLLLNLPLAIHREI